MLPFIFRVQNFQNHAAVRLFFQADQTDGGSQTHADLAVGQQIFQDGQILGTITINVGGQILGSLTADERIFFGGQRAVELLRPFGSDLRDRLQDVSRIEQLRLVLWVDGTSQLLVLVSTVRFFLEVTGVGRAIDFAADRAGEFLDDAKLFVLADEA